MLEQYGKLLFDTGRDPEAQLIHRQLLVLHGDAPAAALDQTRLLILAQRGGKRRDLLSESKQLVEIVQRVRAASQTASVEQDERYEEANRLGEETLRNLAVQIHNEARKTDLEETWAAARALYAESRTRRTSTPHRTRRRCFSDRPWRARSRTSLPWRRSGGLSPWLRARQSPITSSPC